MLPYMLLSTVVSPGDGQPYCIEHSLWCMLEIKCQDKCLKLSDHFCLLLVSTNARII
jgi:hypothetical protein